MWVRAMLPDCTVLGQPPSSSHTHHQQEQQQEEVMRSEVRFRSKANTTYVRSKIKVTTGQFPEDSALPVLSLPPPPPPSAPAPRPLRSSPPCPAHDVDATPVAAATSDPDPTASPEQGQSSSAGGAWPYLCEVCQKGFQYQRMLNRHLKCVRPYKCGLCDKAFTQRCSLESHMKKIHGVSQKYAYKERRNKLYVCEECGHTAGAQEHLLMHMHAAHPDCPFLRSKGPRRPYRGQGAAGGAGAAGGGGGGEWRGRRGRRRGGGLSPRVSPRSR
ncbi:hypothetical protein CRUP_034795 [Coryphaenoides rupestris]|nr:hypothetical protein CRUP_034795 [Coryphaenoides rupestris]